MNIQPLLDRVLLQAISSQKSTTHSGIYLPESNKKEKPFMYSVIAVGPGTEAQPITVKVGDRVLAGQYTGDEIKIDNEVFTIASMTSILAVVQ